MTNRMPPRMPVQAYKTWEVAMPIPTHWRDATCEEVDCGNLRNGWRITVDEATSEGQACAYYIRNGWRPHREETVDGGLTRFHFPPGADCFMDHKTPLDRPQIHSVRGGDWRGRVGKRHIYDRPDQWREDLSLQLDILRKAQG